MILETSKERLTNFLENQGFKAKEFYEKTRIKRGLIDKDKLASSISDVDLTKIIAGFPQLNLYWLITGKGPMFKEEANLTAQPAPEGEEVGTPLISLEAAAGFGNQVFSFSKDDVMARYVVPDFSDIDFMIRVKGSSMYPKYSSGDIIACRIIREITFIQWNKVYVIVTREQGLLCKRIKKALNADQFLIVSDNKDYEPFEIDRTEIEGLALVIGTIRLE